MSLIPILPPWCMQGLLKVLCQWLGICGQPTALPPRISCCPLEHALVMGSCCEFGLAVVFSPAAQCLHAVSSTQPTRARLGEAQSSSTHLIKEQMPALIKDMTSHLGATLTVTVSVGSHCGGQWGCKGVCPRGQQFCCCGTQIMHWAPTSLTVAASLCQLGSKAVLRKAGCRTDCIRDSESNWLKGPHTLLRTTLSCP